MVPARPRPGRPGAGPPQVVARAAAVAAVAGVVLAAAPAAALAHERHPGADVEHGAFAMGMMLLVTAAVMIPAAVRHHPHPTLWWRATGFTAVGLTLLLAGPPIVHALALGGCDGIHVEVDGALQAMVGEARQEVEVPVGIHVITVEYSAGDHGSFCEPVTVTRRVEVRR